ncbi:MAG: hypothetical protein E7497_04205 [Ruminococcus sp.]|nr:hypothetical protein [Ruminococcus sp.]
MIKKLVALCVAVTVWLMLVGCSGKKDYPAETDLSFENSYTASLCEILDKRHFSVTLELFHENTFIGTSIIEVNGDNVHMKGIPVPDEKNSIFGGEIYYIGEKGYNFNDGCWVENTLGNSLSTVNDPDCERLESCFFNSGISPREMTLVKREYDGDSVTETFENNSDRGMESVYITFNKKNGELLCSGYKDYKQEAVSFSENVGEIVLPEN